MEDALQPLQKVALARPTGDRRSGGKGAAAPRKRPAQGSRQRPSVPSFVGAQPARRAPAQVRPAEAKNRKGQPHPAGARLGIPTPVRLERLRSCLPVPQFRGRTVSSPHPGGWSAGSPQGKGLHVPDPKTGGPWARARLRESPQLPPRAGRERSLPSRSSWDARKASDSVCHGSPRVAWRGRAGLGGEGLVSRLERLEEGAGGASSGGDAVKTSPQQRQTQFGVVCTEWIFSDVRSCLREEMPPQELSRRLAAVNTHVDEILQQEVRPLMAVEIIEQLHRQFAILSGGRGEDGAPIITFPEFSGFRHIPDEDFLNVMTYLTSIPSVEAASIGFVVVIDRRRDKWSSVKASLTRIAVAFPGNLQLIFILRPSHFIQRTFTDIGIKYYRNEFKTKVPIILLNSVSDLHGYIDKSQLTRELGGTLEYRHSQWVNHRTAIENFALTLKTTVQMLQTFGASLATTELPRSMLSTEDLLMSHTRQRDKLQDELKLLGKQGATLLSCIQEPATKYPNSKRNLNQLENAATMERLLVQLHETEKAFSQFWSEHHLKLNQCLQLQHFEHDFCKVKLALDNLLEEQAEFTGVGDSVMHVEQLLKEHKKLEEKSQEPLEKAQLLALVGDQLMQSHHDAADTIRPRCVELRHLCDNFINENKKKRDVFGKSLELHRQLDKVSQWCEAGIYLLASQAVDKCQSREGVDVALNDIATFLDTAKEDPLLSPKEFYDEFELLLTLDAKAKAQEVLQRLGDVQEIFHKRQVGLMKLAAKQTRPVQPVAPHPESSPKWVSSKTSQPPTSVPPLRTSEEPHAETELNSWGKEDREANSEVKNEAFESHRERGNPQLEQLARLGDLSPCRRIICDLLETEEIYIKEIKSIIDGYITPMDFMWLKHLIPDVLQNNKDLLFGNIRELYEFHSRTFLKELEKCAENPELLARCFLKRREDLQIYFKYHKNLPRARAIWQECQDCAYFGVCQRQLDHKLPLFKYLRGPSQRLLKYQMLLKGLLDFKSPEDTEIDPSELGGSAKDGPKRTKDSAFSTELQQALAVIEDLIQSCELAVDLAAVTEYPDDIGKLGELLLHSPFSVWTIHKDRYKMKDLIRFKPSQRQVYLFEKGIVFCKIRMEPADQGPFPRYSFKKSLKLMSLSVHQLGRGSHRKFELANQNGLEKYILQAASKEIRDCWFSKINKLLMEQQNDVKDQGNLQFEMGTGKGSGGVGCGPWIEDMERAATSKEDPASSTGGVKGMSSMLQRCPEAQADARLPPRPRLCLASSLPRLQPSLSPGFI
ncbi:probable guanine nucleotide exchange factor MCF2L2 [Cebus imitator]|uniref:probable guanine nucleotide exchange factor MCF2L2 n=1 Tax=Cebus imitator TaxID=2715852 RepID=UPI0018983080|nr:probable guanine nucleotide exchange factor MCF2L2 [Cebus imitator]